MLVTPCLRRIFMVTAAELKAGMVILVEGQIYKVLEVESKAGAAKLSSTRGQGRHVQRATDHE